MAALAFFVSFLLAFLLFSVQPMATKMVLPTLGGTPAVWNTAMLTFQILLLAGYAYAHLLNTRFTPRWQWRSHAILIGLSCALLPLAVSLPASEDVMRHPITYLAAAFLIQLGLPFFCLSATAPLLQAWVSRSKHPLSQTPYVLYSASNLGSLLGLLSYIVIMEQAFTLTQQSELWSVAYVAGALALLYLGNRLLKTAATPAETKATAEKIDGKRIALWIWLAFLPSSLSLGVTTYIATDIASVPLLWVVPLAVYLLSFVDAFRTRPILVPLCIRLGPIVGMGALLVYGLQGHRYTESFVIQLIAFGVLAFAIHGWLARSKPEPQHLTRFYFCMSIGGALGGALNALVAPMIFPDTFEYPITLLLAGLTSFILFQKHHATGISLTKHVRGIGSVMMLVVFNTFAFYLLFSFVAGEATENIKYFDRQIFSMAILAGALIALMMQQRYTRAFYAMVGAGVIVMLTMGHTAVGHDTIFKERNFFGVERVYDVPTSNARYMMHNTTVHGVQPITMKGPIEPLSYYYPLREVLKQLQVTGQHPIGAIGLGAGTVQCFAKEGQRVDFFEINPMVVQLAEDPKTFRYLSDCPGTHDILLGDGRVMMGQVKDGEYGILILDAFSSDAIPAHLLTLESLKMYFDKLAPHGILAIHTTNRHIKLWPLIATQAKAMGAFAIGKEFLNEEGKPMLYTSYWVIFARDAKDVLALRALPGWKELTPDQGAKPWTDQYINILPYLRMLRDDG